MLFHPDSLAAKRPDLIRAHKPRPISPPNPPILYVLYENPSDYPGQFVLRRQRGMEVDRCPVRVSKNHIEVLMALPKNVRPLGRRADQDPVIKDVWAVVS